MATVEKSIDVNVPVRTAYNQWTQFEEFPRFMEGVHEVRQLDAKRLHWRAEIGGVDEEWEAEITEQHPDRVVAWRSITGAPNNGAVSFEPISDSQTRITLHLEYEPKGAMEKIGDMLGVVSSRVEGDLERFKSFIESRGIETGAWRGEVERGGQVHPGGSERLRGGTDVGMTRGDPYESGGTMPGSGMPGIEGEPDSDISSGDLGRR